MAKNIDKDKQKTNSLEQTLCLPSIAANSVCCRGANIALGLIFLKYISDSFETLHNKLIEAKSDLQDATI